MSMISKKKVIYFLLFCFLVIIFFYPFFTVLALEEENKGHLLAYVPADKAQFFQIHFIHSIHKSPVLESYHLNGKEIILDQLEYHQFAVGMPSGAEGDAVYENKDGKIILSKMNHPFPYVDLRVAQVTPEHQLIIKEIPLLFEHIAEPGSWIRLQVRNISFWEMLKGVDFLEYAC